jgi:hypothetical protein
MGGSSFPDLETPRIPAELYFLLRDKYAELLKQYYAEVTVPIEAPEKTSYGDIDFMVMADSSTAAEATFTEVATALNAKATKPAGVTMSLAIPSPELGENCYVQLDIHRCERDGFDWQVFHHAHGDLWNLLGTSLRRQGFTADERGFHVRVEEMELHNKKASRIMVANEPNRVLEFLGLDVARYWKPFGSREELYRYVAGNRFFNRKRYVKEDLKNNDRVRMRKREMYSSFVDEWIPQHPEVDDNDKKTREEHLEDALERFGKRSEYDEKLDAWRKMLEEKTEKKRRRLEAIAAAKVGGYA